MSPEKLQFHIDQNDWFGTTATVLDLMRQDLYRKKYADPVPRSARSSLDDPFDQNFSR
jgi:hypothetical protein